MTGKEYFEKYNSNPWFIKCEDGSIIAEVDLIQMDSEDYEYDMENSIALDDEKNPIEEY